ncbi:MAG TPA: hypothetical protein VJ783_01685, partial [Pirellulales bacterium]|nr:hypothetical protein [Pirellulales bacterium]
MKSRPREMTPRRAALAHRLGKRGGKASEAAPRRQDKLANYDQLATAAENKGLMTEGLNRR